MVAHFTTSIIFILVSLYSLSAQSILSNFSVRQAGERLISIDWTTKAGNTCADLRIERMFEDNGFEEVFRFNGICGEADKAQDYMHNDTIFSGGLYAYRINENNGLYSDTLFIQAFTDGLTAVVYPNPADDELYVRFSNPNQRLVAYTICAIDGKCGDSRFQNPDNTAIEIRALAPGAYQLIASTADGKTRIIRFVRKAR